MKKFGKKKLRAKLMSATRAHSFFISKNGKIKIMIALRRIKLELNKLKNPKKAKDYQWFFKTGPGEYGEGDKFLGLTMPQMRSLVRKYPDLRLDDIQKLLYSGTITGIPGRE